MWKTVKLGDVCDLQNGFAFKSSDYVDKSNTLNIRMSNIRPNGKFDEFHKIKYLPDDYANKYADYKLIEGDLILAMTDMAGDPKILGMPTIIKNLDGRTFLLNQRVGKLHSFSDEICVPYLCYFLSTLKNFFKSKGAGGLQINISKKDILSAEIPLPPLSEQERIVAKLDAVFAEIDDEISFCKQSIDNTNDLFIRHLDYIFENQNLLNSKEWIKSPLKDLCNNFKADIVDGPFGSNLKKSDYIESGIEVLKIQNIKPFHINNKKMSFVSKAKYHELKRHSFISGDIIMTKLGEPLGVCAIVEDLKQGLIVADLVRIRAARINTEFLCYQLNSPIINRYINSQQTGSGRKRIRLSVARELPIVYPSMKVQHQIVKSLDKIKNDIESLLNTYNSKLSNLDSLKSSILNHTLTENIKGNAA